MQGLISRQAALDAMKDMYRAAEKWLRDATDDVTKARAESCMASLIEIKLRTEKLPVVQPEPYWIPCSERLPKKMGYYLTSNEYKVVHEDYYWGNGCFEKAKKYQCEVVAWMPMPIPPYCGGGVMENE